MAFEALGCRDRYVQGGSNWYISFLAHSVSPGVVQKRRDVIVFYHCTVVYDEDDGLVALFAVVSLRDGAIWLFSFSWGSSFCYFTLCRAETSTCGWTHLFSVVCDTADTSTCSSLGRGERTIDRTLEGNWYTKLGVFFGDIRAKSMISGSPRIVDHQVISTAAERLYRGFRSMEA